MSTYLDTLSSVNRRTINEFNTLAVTEFLDQDPRPTFVLDLDSDHLSHSLTVNAFTPLFCNDALRSHHRLLDAICTTSDDQLQQVSSDVEVEIQNFRSWASSVTKFDDSKDVYPLTYPCQGLLWTASTVRRRWRLISGNQYHTPPNAIHDLSAGLPPEVATGGYAVLHSSDRSSDRPNKPQHLVSLNLTNHPRKNHDPKDEANSTLESRSDTLKGTNSTCATGTTRPSLILACPENCVPDYTVKSPKGTLSPHILLMRSIDWASTPLGPMRRWSRELRQVVNLVISSPYPAALFWGSEMTMLYNEAYGTEVAGNKHPLLLGTGFAGPFGEIWDAVGPLFAECARTGQSIRRENQPLAIERFGLLEETFWSWSFTPLYGGTSRIVGFYNVPFETTVSCISQRRMQTLQRLGQSVNGARSVREFWRCILDGIEDNHYDVPFALLYSVGDSDDTDESSMTSGSTISLKSCFYEGSIGIPPGHPAAPHKLDLKRSREGFIPSFREAMRTREPTTLQTRDGTLPEALLEGLEWRGFGDPCREAIIFPLRPTNGENVLAFLLIGVNPRRPYDKEYKAFTSLMNRQLANALASVMLFEEENLRNKLAIEAATLEQENLNQQLASQTGRMQRMTALSPLGMCYLNPEGLIIEANDRYYEMTSQDRNEITEMCWMDHLAEESKSSMEEGWQRLTNNLLPWSAELRLAKEWRDPLNPRAEVMEYWVLCSALPELDRDGSLRCIMGSITDISHLKWAQGLQDRRLREAEETRRQQNEFMDITSHEMRNPLSAILQCADDIVSTMTKHQTTTSHATRSVINDCIESATTIALCVQHQKSIVDDILTVSKLDSNLLMLTPVVVQPVAVVRQTVKMFDSELNVKKIKFNLVIHPSFERYKVDWVSLDPSRMSQIVINFMTNAIKFTSDSKIRKITVSMGVSEEPPVPMTEGFEYIPRKSANTSALLGDDWKTGNAVYIRLKVQDSGCGLTREEIRLLFQRFQQASPRTHAQYGGSGLGLFISRQLTELHGGQIGVASESGVGSTFGFYIKTRRATPEQDAGQPPEIHALEYTWPGQGKLDIMPPPTSELISGDSDKSQPPQSNLQPPSNSTNPPSSSAKPRSTSREQPTSTSAAPSPTPSPIAPLYSVFVVEDNLVNQKVLCKQLIKSNCAVSTADNGQLALDYLRTTDFHSPTGYPLSVVLMDLEMPVMDGLTCVRHIRRLEKEGFFTRHMPVIAVTANVRQEQVQAAVEAGVDSVVSKPFRVANLLAAIETLLKQLAT